MSRIETIGNATLGGTAIYALCEFPSWEMRYVGKTIQFLHQRHKAHIRTHENGAAPAHGGKSGKTFSQYPFKAAMQEVING